MIRLLVDGVFLSPRPKGVGTYTYNVLRRFSEHTESLRMSVLVHGEHLASQDLRSENISYSPVPWRNHLHHGWWTVPRAAAREAAEVAWIPYETTVRSPRVPYAMLCHDIPSRIREAQRAAGAAPAGVFQTLRHRLDDLLIGRGLRGAEIVFANSRYIGRSLTACFGVHPGKIRHAPCAPAADFAELSRRTPPDRLARQLQLENGYILVIYTGDARENLQIVPPVYDRLVSMGLSAGLVVAGVPETHLESVRRLMETYPWRHEVRILPFVDQSEIHTLAALYSAAEVFLEPSLHEGFGMQAVEAMSCRTAVVCSDRGALPEVAGPGACLVDPTNVEEVAAAVARLLRHEDERRELARRGYQRSRDFSWDTTARTILQGLQDVAERRRHARRGR